MTEKGELFHLFKSRIRFAFKLLRFLLFFDTTTVNSPSSNSTSKSFSFTVAMAAIFFATWESIMLLLSDSLSDLPHLSYPYPFLIVQPDLLSKMKTQLLIGVPET